MWQKSKCIQGWLHDFRIVKTYPTGVLERCLKCGKQKFFHNETPNHIYLSYHLRSALGPDHKRYYKEYNKQYNG